MKSLLLRAALWLTLISAGSVSAAETTLTSSDGSTAWLYMPAEKPDPAKTYWLVVGVHGVGANGEGACGAAYLAKAFDDGVALGPSFSQPERDKDAPRPPGCARFTTSWTASTTRRKSPGSAAASGTSPSSTTTPGAAKSGNLNRAHEQRLRERSNAERVNSLLKCRYGSRRVRVRGAAKVMSHLTFASWR